MGFGVSRHASLGAAHGERVGRPCWALAPLMVSLSNHEPPLLRQAQDERGAGAQGERWAGGSGWQGVNFLTLRDKSRSFMDLLAQAGGFILQYSKNTHHL